jgi:hypothetical protein
MRDRMRRPPGELLDAAAERSRSSVRERLGRLRATYLTIGQCALAAGLAWLVAGELVGHGAPFFAPIAAILTLGLTYGQRGRRAFELAGGVAIGIGVGDLIVLAIGSGWWQIAVVVALAMAAAVLVGGSPLLVNQCAVSAVLVATLQPAAHTLSGARFVDAVVGAAIALIINALVPTDPIRLVRREAEPLLDQLADVLADAADALEHRDLAAVKAAVGRADAIDPSTDRLREAVAVGREMATLTAPRRRLRGHLDVYATAYGQLELAVRNVRVLARVGIRAIELDDHVPPRAIEAIRELAASVRELGGALAREGGSEAAEQAALRAAALSTAALEETANLSASVIVGQVRSTAVDLLRSMGMSADEARGAVRDARARLAV